MIGKFIVDLESVYVSSVGHEMYREWVPLEMNEEPVGFLKVTISVLGPGDSPVAHDRTKEKAAEKTGGKPEGTSLGKKPKRSFVREFIILLFQ